MVYNIYTSLTSRGPWTLNNSIPIAHIELGNSYELQNLEPDIIYYVTIVGGILDEDDEFIPLINQSVGPLSIGAKDINSTRADNIIITQRFNHLSLEFGVTGSTTDLTSPSLSFQFGANMAIDNLSMQYNVDTVYTNTEDNLSMQFSLNAGENLPFQFNVIS